MSARICNKENTLGTERKSKLPVPSGVMSAKKGVKRPNSGTENMPEVKRSPTKPMRRPLIETKETQKTATDRTVTKAKRIITKGQQASSTSVMAARQSKRLLDQKGFKETRVVRKNTIMSQMPVNDVTANSAAFDQKGIEFETDACSLQSILDNTGIKRPPPAAPKTPEARHTLAGTSVGGQKANFRRWCDDFLSRQSVHQSKAKRQCTNNRTNPQESGFNFDMSQPSDVDFCGKYNASTNPSFTSSTDQDNKGEASRQSLQGRPSAVARLSRYATPGKDGRLSLASRTPLRVKKEAKGAETGDPGTGVRFSMCPPARIPKKSESADIEGSDDFAVPQRLSLFGKQGLASQHQGPLFGRPSLAAQNTGTELFSRPSLAAQTPGKIMPGRLSLAAQTPRRVLKPATETTPGVFENEPRISQGPGRVLKTVAESSAAGCQKEPRFSLAAQTPGRVFKPAVALEENDSNVFNPKLKLESLIQESEGRSMKASTSSLTSQTPGRVLRKETVNGIEKGVSESIGGKCGTDPALAEYNANYPGTSNTETRAMNSIGSMSQEGHVADGAQSTPRIEIKSKSIDDHGTPSRVVKQPVQKAHTPLRVLQTHDLFCKRTPKPMGIGTPTSVKQSNNGISAVNMTPLRVIKSESKDSHWLSKESERLIYSPVLGTPKPTVVGMPITPKRTNNGVSAVNMTPHRILRSNTDDSGRIALESKQMTGTPPTGLQRKDAINKHVHKWTEGNRTPETITQTTTGLSLTPQGVSHEAQMTGTETSFGVSDEVLSPVTKMFSRHGLSDKRDSPKNSPGFTMDLRAMWKTKKSTLKTPVKKEILTSVIDGGVMKAGKTSPRACRLTGTSEKKKKTLTWADKLKTCSLADQTTPDTQLQENLPFLKDDNIDTDSEGLLFHVEEPVCSSDVIGPGTEDQNNDDSQKRNDHGDVELAIKVDYTQSAQYEMQQGPTQEKRTTSPHSTSPQTFHNSPALPSQSESETMQLPVGAVCSPISSREGVAVDNRSWSQSGSEISGSRELRDLTEHNNVIKQILDDPVTWARLQECWKLKVKGNTCSGYEMNVAKNSGEDKTSEMSLNISNNNNLESEMREYCQESGKVWSPKNDERVAGNSEDVDNHSQGLSQAHTRALDVNSNITLSANITEQSQCTQNMTMLENHQIQTSPRSTTTKPKCPCEPVSPLSKPSSKRQQDCDENITPFILRNKSDAVVNIGFSKQAEDSNESMEDIIEEKENDVELKLQTERLYFPTPMAVVKREEENQSETGPTSLDLPIWTPLVLKAVAKQQRKCMDSVMKDLSFNTSSQAIKIVSPERQVLSEMTDVGNTSKDTQKPMTTVLSSWKEPTGKATAFRPVGRPMKVTPSVGPLSLRANLNTNLKHKRISKKNVHLASILQMEYERYQEAMLDDEVELYTCRLVKKKIVGHQRECCNPVAKILTEGDDMSFVPIQMEVEGSEKMNKLESAFEKCMRST